jgi:hypothetical protein
MKTFKEKITLTNAADEELAASGRIKKEEIRSVTLDALIGSGSRHLVISDELRKKLGLRVLKTTETTVTGGTVIKTSQGSPLSIYWGNRDCTCRPVVVPFQEEPLLGALPMEAMDLTIDMAEEKLVGKHGDQPLGIVM